MASSPYRQAAPATDAPPPQTGLPEQFGRIADSERAGANLVGLFRVLLAVDARRSMQ